MPDPTPRLTAEHAAAQILLVKIFGTADFTDQIKEVLDAVIASATRQAFEQAAAKGWQVLCDLEYPNDVRNAVKSAILALAKEQPSTET